MTLSDRLAELVRNGVVLTLRDGSVDVAGPRQLITPAVVDFLRANKADVVAWIASQEAKRQQQWTGCTFVDPAEMPACPVCLDICDTESLSGSWHCSKCDPNAGTRRIKTNAVLRLRELILCRLQKRNPHDT